MLDQFLSYGAVPFLACVCILAVAVALAAAWLASQKAGTEKQQYWLLKSKMPAFAELSLVDENLRAKRADLKEVEAKIMESWQQFGEAERSKAEAQHWQELLDRHKAQYGRLSEERQEIDRVQESLTKLLADVATLRADAATQREETERLHKRRAELEEQVSGLDAKLKAASDITSKLADAESDYAHAMAKLTEAKADAEAARLEARTAKSTFEGYVRQAESFVKKLSELADEVKALESERDDRKAELAAAKKELAGLDAVRTEMARANEAAAAAEAKHRTVEALIAERQRHAETLDKQIKELEDKRGKLSGTTAGGASDAAVMEDLKRRPTCLFGSGGAKLLPDRQGVTDEMEMLRKVQEHIAGVGLKFDNRVIRRFHTSLKSASISPLTVLAGISGTGKSQLPQRYAEAMGMYFLKIPVQPRWDSPQDLLGFYNYLEKSYKATDFARALIYMDSTFGGLPAQDKMGDRMMLVLLDEMNLARIEYYFSEFLSRLEGRPNPGVKDEAALRAHRIDIEIPSRDGSALPTIYPGHNVLFAGTMNEDETTQSLSDKVLDRANVMRFQRPEKFDPVRIKGQGVAGSDRHLPFSTWDSWCRKTDKLEGNTAIMGQCGEFISKLNTQMAKLRRPFAFRVNQAILSYVVNYPNYTNPTEANAALSDMMEMRIL
ncbi:MAG: hypothetical protein WCJ64_08290, partial [Rhodospirillaceae bacterium]